MEKADKGTSEEKILRKKKGGGGKAANLVFAENKNLQKCVSFCSRQMLKVIPKRCGVS